LPKNEDGEFELVLGNHQLFGVFFIVVMLFGVFFVMGYIVGQNSAPLVRTDVASVHKTDTKPIVVDSPGRTEEPPPASPPETATPVETAPQKAAPIETAPAKAPVKTKEQPEKPAPPPARATSNQPVAGETYLQLVATGKDQADAMVDVLRKNSFRALDYEAPEKPGTFRVLVGPIKDGEREKVRAELQGKGFPGRDAIPKKF
jgi:cell division septation protein DedD